MSMMTGIVALLVALAFAGCSWIPKPALPWSSSAPKPDPTADALFQDGLRYFNEKRYVRAIDAFQKIKTDHPFSPHLIQAELRLADAYYLNKQYPEAITAFKEFQSLHPTNENIPFVLYRLGQAHFDQFTSTDRDQKNTELAKSYFESVITNHPKSPYAAEAKAKLIKTLEYLAESEFNVAHFYFQQEKYPAARDRLEEIVRKYRDTPTAVKSLFYLGECYRKEKNAVKAALAYEALVQHYPTSKFVAEAKTQLAQIEKEKHDPLAMLLMRDRRPGAATQPQLETGQDPALAKLRDLNLVAKTEVVYEEPGAQKGFFRRVVDTINPFADDGKKEGQKAEDGLSVLAKKKAEEKEQSPGLLSWLNPFSGRSSKPKQTASDGSKVVGQVDESLRQKGIDAANQQVALNPPAAALPKIEEPAPPPPTMDSREVLAAIDSNLKKEGKQPTDTPPPPEAAEVFKEAQAAQIAATTKAAKPEPAPSATATAVLSSIDQKLKSQGVEPSQFEPPPAPAEKPSAPRPQPAQQIELEPKLVDRGPFRLPASPVSPRSDEPAAAEETSARPESAGEPAVTVPEAVVRGAAQPSVQAAKPAEPKKPGASDEDQKGVLEQMKEDVDRVGRILNPFRW
ncbi:MAG TPA: outer membrane protein assembly factor BamD [Candidatus Eisenbacteria bacterium]|nr:outer membrane protein assembly factor BamD [Candidatus Eisenbacteria bacterium]